MFWDDKARSLYTAPKRTRRYRVRFASQEHFRRLRKIGTRGTKTRRMRQATRATHRYHILEGEYKTPLEGKFQQGENFIDIKALTRPLPFKSKPPSPNADYENEYSSGDILAKLIIKPKLTWDID